MGSFQQICLGAICLVAAYLFGNYVNNNPPPLHSDNGSLVNGVFGSQTANGLTDNSGNPSTTTGNIESRLPISDFSPIENKPAPIVTMKTPLKSRFAVPTIQTNPVAEFGYGGPGGSSPSNQLPPPSQLAEQTQQSQGTLPSSPFSSSPFAEPAAVAPTIQVPDFSAIAAEFKNTPIELPAMSRLGGMPSYSNTQPVPGNQFGNGPNSGRSDNQLKDLVRRVPANGVRNQNFGTPAEYSIEPSDLQSGAQSAAQKQYQTANHPEHDQWGPPAKSNREFSQADFEPKLNDDIFGLKAPAKSIYESPQGQAFEPKQERLQSVSKNPMPDYQYDNVPPPVPSGYEPEDRTTSAFRGNLTFRTELENRQSDSTVEQVGNRGIAPIDSRPSQARTAASRSSSNQQSRLPFRLTDNAKTELVQLRQRADSKIGLESTSFVDHTIRDGETLQSISARYFGSPNYYLDIYLANRNKLRNPADTRTGISIRVPVYESP